MGILLGSRMRSLPWRLGLVLLCFFSMAADGQIHGRPILPYSGSSRTPCRWTLEGLRANTTVNTAAQEHFLVAHDSARLAYIDACRAYPNATVVCWHRVEVSPSQIDFGKPQTSLERQRLYHSTKHMLVPFCAPKACSSNSLNAIAAADIQWQCKSTLNRDCTIKRFYGCAAHEWRPPVV